MVIWIVAPTIAPSCGKKPTSEPEKPTNEDAHDWTRAMEAGKKANVMPALRRVGRQHGHTCADSEGSSRVEDEAWERQPPVDVAFGERNEQQATDAEDEAAGDDNLRATTVKRIRKTIDKEGRGEGTH